FNVFTKASSISLPICTYNPFSTASFLSIVLIVEKSVILFTSSIICLSFGGTICAPSSQYTLYPLYSGGLWLAVIITPAVHPNFLTVKESSGTGLKDSNT